MPADSVVKTAVLGRGEVHHYPCDHFDVWAGHDWFEKGRSSSGLVPGPRDRYCPGWYSAATSLGLIFIAAG